MKNQDLLISVAPSPLILLMFGAILSFGPVITIMTVITGDNELYGIFILLVTALIWLSVATIRVKVGPDYIERYVFWHRSWIVKLEDVRFTHGIGGDIPVAPAIILMDVTTGEKVGEILKIQFMAQDLVKFEGVLNSIGILIGRT